MTSVFLADDHPVVRQGLRTLLAGEPDLQVVGEESDGLRVAALVERLAPDVLLLDVSMPGKNGLEVTREVAQRSPRTRVLILSMHANEEYVLEALRAGAAGYVLKDSAPEEILRAVRDVAAGRRHLGPPFSDRAVEAYAERTQPEALDPFRSLTDREREVLQMAAEGHGNAEIGRRLFISPRTVEVHRANLMRKLGLANQTDLVRFALRRGILPADR